MILGAHVSASGNLSSAITKAKELDISAIQIFISPPQNWNDSKYTPDNFIEFGKNCAQHNIDHIFLHAIYLINLASSNPDFINKSIHSLISYLNASSLIRADGVIFHIGSSKDTLYSIAMPSVIKNIKTILDNSDSKSSLIIETTAGQGSCIGSNFSQIADIINEVNSPRLFVCLDTVHTFSSGYDWINTEPSKIFNEFDKTIGLNKLKAIHLNDSKTDFNSHKDRHENIGQGKIGDTAISKIIKLPKIQQIPFILEVPGYDDKGVDIKNIQKVRELAK